MFFRDLNEKNDLSNQQDCKLPDGTPIYLITNIWGVKQVIDALKGEQVIGIDTEWKPHYAYFKEQYLLIAFFKLKFFYFKNCVNSNFLL